MEAAPQNQLLSFEDTSVAFAQQSDSKLQKTYLIFAMMNQNWLVKIGTFFIKFILKIGLPVKFLIKNTLFEQFCGGESIETCQKTIENLARGNVGTILDYSVEGEDNENDFDKTTDEVERTIIRASQQATNIPFSVFKVSGVGSVELLEKVQERPEMLTKEDKAAFQRIHDRVNRLCQLAAQLNVRIFLDAEESWIQDVIDNLCYEMMKKYNVGGKTIVYNTYQLYRWASLDNLINACENARKNGYTVGAKLVRGAYMEKERRRAAEMEYQSPIQATKEDTDKDFNKAVYFAVENTDILSICLGTHNEDSCLLCVKLMQEKGIAKNDSCIWFAQLLGMSDNISYNLANAGYNVAKYVPYGPVEAVMPYLFRRADENTSIAGQSSREFLLVKKERERRTKKAA
ncbi:Proline dehydrogenase [Emticicia oligotrophica DSM 17448]|uniref:Proline dehydrogenase n=1 Tax=Emticicia oligotrophica (strain DSM 17448 / CIP 109782 / MTCC 6937 / GPTSA100-15) TaxID=929562 RepID=A0ABM5N4Q0_EMTOG|nr:proline dehydrogenase family protein [Emticicia oligotrophica]AFK04422.1 Proline dehydrogenase [Emticicia oligotrophica DSM 17448]